MGTTFIILMTIGKVPLLSTCWSKNTSNKFWLPVCFFWSVAWKKAVVFCGVDKAASCYSLGGKLWLVFAWRRQENPFGIVTMVVQKAERQGRKMESHQNNNDTAILALAVLLFLIPYTTHNTTPSKSSHQFQKDRNLWLFIRSGTIEGIYWQGKYKFQ